MMYNDDEIKQYTSWSNYRLSDTSWLSIGLTIGLTIVFVFFPSCNCVFAYPIIISMFKPCYPYFLQGIQIRLIKVSLHKTIIATI